MLKHNSYFDGNVQSIGFERLGRRMTVGVIHPGEYHFGTDAPERMTVVSGEIEAKLGGDAWRAFPAGTVFEVPGKSGFDFAVEMLRLTPEISFQDLRDRARLAGLNLPPIVYGRAKALLGLVPTKPRRRREPPAEVAGGGRVGNPLRPERIQIRFVVASQFQMLQTPATRQEVVGDVQHMIGLAVGQPQLEEGAGAIDRLGQIKLLDQFLHHPQPAGRRGQYAICQFILDGRR